MTASPNSAFVGSERAAYSVSSLEDSADLVKVETVVDPLMGVWSSKSDKAVAEDEGDLETGTDEIRRVSAFLSLQDDSDCESVAMVASGRVTKTSLKSSRSASRERKGTDDVEITGERVQIDSDDSFETVQTPRTVTFAPASEGVHPNIAARGRQASRRSDPDVTRIIEEAIAPDEQDSIDCTRAHRVRTAPVIPPPREGGPCTDGCKRTTK